MNEYWAKREITNLYNRRLGVADRELSKQYIRCFNGVIGKAEALYDEILASYEDGSILISDLYKFNRYYDLMNELNTRLLSLGEKEIQITNKALTDMYLTNSQLITDELLIPIPVDDNAVKNAINAIWCQDGKHWSQRIWINKAELQERLKNGLVDCVARGVPRGELNKELVKVMNVGFYQADRIVRTELNYIQNKSTYDRFCDAGIKKYRYLAKDDDRTCAACLALNGKVFRMEDAQVGVNFPPLHPNTRSTITAVIDED